MMDADPRTNARLACTFDPKDFEDIDRAVRTRRPRFIIGYGQRAWTADGRYETVHALPEVLRDYQSADPGDPKVLVRRQ